MLFTSSKSKTLLYSLDYHWFNFYQKKPNQNFVYKKNINTPNLDLGLLKVSLQVLKKVTTCDVNCIYSTQKNNPIKLFYTYLFYKTVISKHLLNLININTLGIYSNKRSKFSTNPNNLIKLL